MSDSQVRSKISYPFYGAYYFFYLGLGALLPYVFLFLRENRGMSEPAVGVAALLAPLAVMLAQPVWGFLSDLTGRPVAVIQVASLSAGATALAMSFQLSAAWYFLLVPLFYMLQSAVDPLVNAAAVHNEAQSGSQGEFGQKRLWGSLGFITGNLVAAQLTGIYGLTVVFFVYAVSMVLLALQVFALTDVRMDPVTFTQMRRGLREAVKRPAYRKLLLYLVVWGIPFGGNSVAFGWFWTDVGGASSDLGYIWFLAAVFEIPLYYLTSRFKAKVSFRLLLVVSTCAAGLRWLIYVLFPVPELLYWVQPLHAVMFVCLSVGAVYMIDSLSDPVIRSTGQSLLAACVYGLGSALGNLSAGLIYGYLGAAYFYGFLIFCNFFCLLVILSLRVDGDVGATGAR